MIAACTGGPVDDGLTRAAIAEGQAPGERALIVPPIDPANPVSSLNAAGYEIVSRSSSETHGTSWLHASKEGSQMFVTQSADATRIAGCKLEAGVNTGVCLELGSTADPLEVSAPEACHDTPICGCEPIQPPIDQPASCSCTAGAARSFSTRIVVSPRACAALGATDCTGSLATRTLIADFVAPSFARANQFLDDVCAELQPPDPESVVLLESFDESRLVSDACALVGLSLLAQSLSLNDRDVTFYLVFHPAWRGRAIQVPAGPGRCAGALLEIGELAADDLLLAHEFGHVLGGAHLATEQPAGCTTTYDWASALPGTLMVSSVGDQPITATNECAMNTTVTRFW